MKKYLKKVTAADAVSAEEQFEGAIDALEDDFEYVVEGFRAIARDGSDAQRQATQLAMQLNDSVTAMMQQIADIIAEQER